MLKYQRPLRRMQKTAPVCAPAGKWRAWLVAFAVFWAATLPAGMPAAAGDGLVLICTSDGIRAVNPDTGKPDGTGVVSHGFCSLCANHHTAITPDLAPNALPTGRVMARQVFTMGEDVLTGYRIGAKHSRAPPFFI
ncbi:MAG: DUF2946 family protein [Pseudomonadota bacterium]